MQLSFSDQKLFLHDKYFKDLQVEELTLQRISHRCAFAFWQYSDEILPQIPQEQKKDWPNTFIEFLKEIVPLLSSCNFTPTSIEKAFDETWLTTRRHGVIILNKEKTKVLCTQKPNGTCRVPRGLILTLQESWQDCALRSAKYQLGANFSDFLNNNQTPQEIDIYVEGRTQTYIIIHNVPEDIKLHFYANRKLKAVWLPIKCIYYKQTQQSIYPTTFRVILKLIKLYKDEPIFKKLFSTKKWGNMIIPRSRYRQVTQTQLQQREEELTNNVFSLLEI